MEAAELAISVLLKSINVSAKPTIDDRFDMVILLNFLVSACLKTCPIERIDSTSILDSWDR
jgi:hypothetical protein